MLGIKQGYCPLSFVLAEFELAPHEHQTQIPLRTFFSSMHGRRAACSFRHQSGKIFPIVRGYAALGPGFVAGGPEGG